MRTPHVNLMDHEPPPRLPSLSTAATNSSRRLPLLWSSPTCAATSIGFARPDLPEAVVGIATPSRSLSTPSPPLQTIGASSSLSTRGNLPSTRFQPCRSSPSIAAFARRRYPRDRRSEVKTVRPSVAASPRRNATVTVDTATPPPQSRRRPSPIVVRGRADLGEGVSSSSPRWCSRIARPSFLGARLRSGEKSVGVTGESMPLVFEGVIMIQEWCTVWYTSGQSKTIRIAMPTVMGGGTNATTTENDGRTTTGTGEEAMRAVGSSCTNARTVRNTPLR
uniref:Uncharacterized protein n=1 Tax=Oryza sativa subsp. japonica TaxID=39947 RepID=Q6Z5Q3_ORYSJ|nr:hypothetical protein [Oryza sativa Japonica Group]